MQENQCQSLLSETADEREARVESLRANQNRRLSSDDREARLQRMREYSAMYQRTYYPSTIITDSPVPPTSSTNQ